MGLRLSSFAAEESGQNSIEQYFTSSHVARNMEDTVVDLSSDDEQNNLETDLKSESMQCPVCGRLISCGSTDTNAKLNKHLVCYRRFPNLSLVFTV
jgi:hypothetical protein